MAIPGSGVAGIPIDEVQVRVVDAGGPGRAAAVLPGVAGPGVVARLAGTWNRVRRPTRLAGLRVEGLDKAANAELASGHTGEHHILDDQGGAGNAVALLPIDDLDFPHHLASAHVERDEPGVHRPDVDQIAPDRHATVDRAAAVDALRLVGKLGIVAPLPRSGPRVDGEDARPIGRNVDHTVVNQRRCLQAAVFTTGREHPHRMQPVHVGWRNLVELNVAVAVVVPAIHQPR